MIFLKTFLNCLIILSLYSCIAESNIEVLQFEETTSSDSDKGNSKISTPPFNGSTSITKLSLGLNGNSCAVDSSGDLYCWGRNYDGDDFVQGLLGTNIATNTDFNSLQHTDPGTSFKSVSLGEFVNCAITSTDSVKCWGRGYATGTPSDATNKLIPTDIEDLSGDSYLYVDSGSYHSCAITTGNVLKCWGDNWNEKLGRTNDRSAVIESDSGTLYYQVSGGRNHTCGITTNHKIKCFGSNTQGQIGNGIADANAHTPTQIDGSVDYKFISATENGNCAITTNNKLKCWGSDTYGRTGNGATTGNVTLPTLIDSSENYKSVDTGIHHTCAITTSNKLKCWGRNNVGQIGTGSTGADIEVPTLIDGANDYKEVAVGGWGNTHTCALRLNGDLRCWGSNNAGQLGLGDNIDRTTGSVEVQAGFN